VPRRWRAGESVPARPRLPRRHPRRETGDNVGDVVRKAAPDHAAEWRNAPSPANPPPSGCTASSLELGAAVLKDTAEAFYWFRRAAGQGLPAAQTWVGHCYKNGFVAAKNTATAERWYRRAAAQDFPMAQYYHGYCVEMGWGTDSDAQQAAALYRNGRDQGYLPAMNAVGNCHKRLRRGQGSQAGRRLVQESGRPRPPGARDNLAALTGDKKSSKEAVPLTSPALGRSSARTSATPRGCDPRRSRGAPRREEAHRRFRDDVNRRVPLGR